MLEVHSAVFVMSGGAITLPGSSTPTRAHPGFRLFGTRTVHTRAEGDTPVRSRNSLHLHAMEAYLLNLKGGTQG